MPVRRRRIPGCPNGDRAHTLPRTLTLISVVMLLRLYVSSALMSAALSPLEAQRAFRVEETTIAQVHAAIRGGGLTCRALVQAYLRRIDAYDKRGPAINAITVVNPEALSTADSLDRRFAATRKLVGPLHCVPMIVKDNFQTIGLQTAAGNIALKGYAPTADAFRLFSGHFADAQKSIVAGYGNGNGSPYGSSNGQPFVGVLTNEQPIITIPAVSGTLGPPAK